MVTIRRATQDDYDQIDHLMYNAKQLTMRVSWDDLHLALARHPFFLVEDQNHPVCVCGLFVEPDQIGQIRVFVLHPSWTATSLMPRLLDHMIEELPVSLLAFIGSEKWLLRALEQNGFRQIHVIETWQKTDWAVPHPGNPHVIVRAVEQRDFEAIADIDQAAFAPLWRNTPDMLARQQTQSDYFTVAEWDGQIVGYVYADMLGRHGHLTRLAVHPAFQGQHIAARLLVEALCFMQQRRVFGITLNTQQDNVRSRRLYDWFGFTLLDENTRVLVREVFDQTLLLQ